MRFEHVYAIDRILNAARTPVARKTLEQELEISRASVKRVLSFMRDRLNAPIEYNREHDGYYYDHEQAEGYGPKYELPGLWLSEDEIQAMLSLQQLLSNLPAGLLDTVLAPLKKRLTGMLEQPEFGEGQLASRVRVLAMAARPPGPYFRTVAGAVVQRRQMQIEYAGRSGQGSDVVKTRVISPQRLTHYRDNWYLDAWCHDAKGLRTFALDRISAAEILESKSKDVAQKELDEELSSSYGIFSGKPTGVAILRFTAQRARWVSQERWHADQRSEWDQQGRYILHIPYSHSEELIMDILKFGADVEVLSPDSLRQQVCKGLQTALALYTD